MPDGSNRRSPRDVVPKQIAEVLPEDPWWFVIGGQAVRCFCPYRPSVDVDFGVRNPADLDSLLQHLRAVGKTEVLEQESDTVHLLWNGINVSVFVLESLADHTEDRRLTVDAILATKLHAILDRGRRRDFFDLYVMLHQHRMGIVQCIQAMRDVYRQPINDNLLLRALVYFDDADNEAPLPNEGALDWRTVKDYLLARVGDLLVPPSRKLVIQSQRIDVERE